MRKCRILVTGASGLLGLNLALEAAEDARPSLGRSTATRCDTDAFTVVQADLLAPGARRAPAGSNPARLGDPLRCAGQRGRL